MTVSLTILNEVEKKFEIKFSKLENILFVVWFTFFLLSLLSLNEGIRHLSIMGLEIYKLIFYANCTLLPFLFIIHLFFVLSEKGKEELIFIIAPIFYFYVPFFNMINSNHFYFCTTIIYISFYVYFHFVLFPFEKQQLDKKEVKELEQLFINHFNSNDVMSLDDKLHFFDILRNSNDEKVKNEIVLMNDLISSGLKYDIDSSIFNPFFKEKKLKKQFEVRLNHIHIGLKHGFPNSKIKEKIFEIMDFVERNQGILHESSFHQKIDEFDDKENKLFQKIENFNQFNDENAINTLENECNQFIETKKEFYKKLDDELNEIKQNVKTIITNKHKQNH